MTKLNYEPGNKLKNGYANAYDELPKTGSWADQQRYFTDDFPTVKSKPISGKSSKQSRAQNALTVKERKQQELQTRLRQKIQAIGSFLEYVKSDAFKKRDRTHQRQILQQISAALASSSIGPGSDMFNRDPVVRNAKSLLKREGMQ